MSDKMSDKITTSPATQAGRALSEALGQVSKGVIAFYNTDDLSNSSHRTAYRRNDTRPNIAMAISTLYDTVKLQEQKGTVTKPERTFAVAIANMFRNMIITGRMVGGISAGYSETDNVVNTVKRAANAAAASIDRTYGQLVDEDDEIMALAIDLYVINEDHITGENPYVSALELVGKTLVEMAGADSTPPVAVSHLMLIAMHIEAARKKVKQRED